ncbi:MULTISPECIES: MFS transporter [Streptosporangium]|uniref:MFS family permease n=1 Tax=Streptosporangium brasiliense TaxID=47480 RepID=A0ABT9R4I3_9ACTN|nr:MFS transporter [Streptosporangium brasiliense]MDP9864134.1 MFS family permease [Streptosporangium brasiliense]
MYKKSPWTAVGVLAFAVAVGTLQMTAVVPMLPVLQRQLHAPLPLVSWTLTAALLSGAVAIPLLSRLGDLYGRRPVALAALGLLVAGALLSAVATTLPLIIAGRVLQGMAAPLLPLAMGIARQAVPRDRLPTAIGVLSAMMGVGSGGGMILAGLVGGGYQALFWILAGLGAASFALVAVLVREPAHAAPGGRPDLAGAALVATWLVCLLLAVNKGTAWGWTSPSTLGLLAAAAVVAVIWVLSARRTATPLIEIPMLLHRGTVGATVASLLLGFALFAAITTLSSVAQGSLGASVLQVGLYLLPTAALMLVISLLAGRLMRRFTTSSLVGSGSLLVAAASLWLSVSHGTPSDLYGAAAVLGVGIGLGYAALGTMAVEHVEPARTAAAGGVNALVRVFGSSLAGVVTAAVISSAGAGWSFGASAIAATISAASSYVHGALARVPDIALTKETA